MPASWVAAGAAVLGAGQSMGWWGDQGGQGGGGAQFGPGISYGQNNIPNVDAGWAHMYDMTQAGGQQAYNTANALNLQALQQGQAINYQPYLNASTQAGQQTGQLANTIQGYGQTMGQQGQNAFAQQAAMQKAGLDVYNLGRDPREEQYKENLMKAQNQANAISSMYGLGSSGAGAGIANEAVGNFQQDWQNQKLNRALAGLQGYNAAQQTALGYGQQGGQDLTSAAALQGMVPGLTQQAAQIPLNAQQYVAQQPQNLANQYLATNAAAMSPLYTNMSQQLAYLTGGSASQAGAAQLQQQQQQFNAQQQQQGMSGFVQGINQLADLWKNSSWGGGGSGGSGGWTGGDYADTYAGYA